MKAFAAVVPALLALALSASPTPARAADAPPIKASATSSAKDFDFLPRAEFFGDDTDDGKPIYVRYRWDATQAERPHWEPAFSLDRGKTWETNWTTDFTRVK